MARKGREPLSEAPPPADSSSDEGSDDEGEQTHSTSSDEDDEKTPSPLPEKPSAVKKGPIHKKIEPPKPGESDSESDSEDSDLPPPLKVKPIASKPAEDGSKVKKAGSKAAGKRSAPENEGPAKKTKSDQKAVSSGGGLSQEEGGKKALFQRLWSEEDELAIIKGMIDYKAKKVSDPMTDLDDFLEFIKKSLHFADANKAQILNKMKRLKKRFENGKRRKINNTHELKVFELSKHVWGETDGVEDANGFGENHNLNAKGSSRGSTSKLKGNKAGVNGLGIDGGKKQESGKKVGENDDDLLRNWVVSRCDRQMPVFGGSSIGYLNEGVLKEGMKLLGEKEKVEMAEKLRKHNLVEMEVYLKRLDLVREVAQKTLNALKSAQH